MKAKTILIANRGEIAVRVIRAAKALGRRTAVVYSDADKDSLAVHLADDAVNIGPPAAKKSYLNFAAILQAAKSLGADAIHPGYGFLAENADFAEAVTSAGIKFVGPSARAIRLLGDKAAARHAAIEAGVPVVPGSNGRIADAVEARRCAQSIGYPVMIKAAAGGGGRGIRVVRRDQDFESQFLQAAGEASASFGDGGLYIEKFIDRARHIEVQILGDGHKVLHCFERECSLQRRRQKIWEEAPAFTLPDEVRTKLCASAAALGSAVGYRGAGTVEYLYDNETGQFHFIEVNTRIQVEHPVTEMITGIDLVQAMLRISDGDPLTVQQGEISRIGHAIECRINAEDPYNNFRPSPGRIERLEVPQSSYVRFDSHLFEGYIVPPFYDSLLGKLIVYGDDREQCLVRLRAALDALVIVGVPTTIPLHQTLAQQADVIGGQLHTGYLESWLESEFGRKPAFAGVAG